MSVVKSLKRKPPNFGVLCKIREWRYPKFKDLLNEVKELQNKLHHVGKFTQSSASSRKHFINLRHIKISSFYEKSFNHVFLPI